MLFSSTERCNELPASHHAPRFAGLSNVIWTFILVTPLLMQIPNRGAIAESVHLASRDECIGYAEGRMSNTPTPHTALCVNRVSGEIVDLKRPVPGKQLPDRR